MPKAASDTGMSPDGRKRTVSLEQQVNRKASAFPTPRSSDAMLSNSEKIAARGTYRGRLEERIALEHHGHWPTPRANDAEKRGNVANDPRNGLVSAAGQGDGGQLNPDWVEWLMGFHIGWTNANNDTPVPLVANGLYWTPEPPITRLTRGMKNRPARLKALGNAIVPQVAAAIGEAILEAHFSPPTPRQN